MALKVSSFPYFRLILTNFFFWNQVSESVKYIKISRTSFYPSYIYFLIIQDLWFFKICFKRAIRKYQHKHWCQLKLACLPRQSYKMSFVIWSLHRAMLFKNQRQIFQDGQRTVYSWVFRRCLTESHWSHLLPALHDGILFQRYLQVLHQTHL